MGNCLRQLAVKPEDVCISNKLGWFRTELKTAEPTFEPGIWKGLKHDAVQKISYDGIIDCFEQGNELLGGYATQLVSVHDPDEYLVTALDGSHAEKLFDDILDAYEALHDLKQQGKVQAVGIGAKNWKVIKWIANDVQFDWVMIANSLTIKNHPEELLAFIDELNKKGVTVINSAVFHSGFLVGSDYYDYKQVAPATHPELFEWRAEFFQLCQSFGIKPAEACVQFSFKVPGIVSVALNTSDKKRVKANIDVVSTHIPDEFWCAMKAKGLIREDFPYL